jgi:AraC-like DNA-binding protein
MFRNGTAAATSSRRIECAAPSGILSTAATGLIPFIQQRGGDPDRIIGAAGGSLDTLERTAGAMPLGLFCRIFECAARQTQDLHFGLGYGLQFQPADLGILGYIALSSASVGHALANMRELFHRHQHSSHFDVMPDGARTRIEYRILDRRIQERRQDAELSIGMFLNVLRHFLGCDWTPLAISFEHDRVGTLRDYERRLGTIVHFCQPSNAILLRREELDRANASADARLLALLRISIDHVGLAEQHAASLSDRVSDAIRARLVNGEPALRDIASDLNIPDWTLQRRLRVEGSSYQGVLADTRRGLALKYLQNAAIPLAELAFLLGYSEHSAFTRAFHKWMSTSPSEWRRRCLGGG